MNSAVVLMKVHASPTDFEFDEPHVFVSYEEALKSMTDDFVETMKSVGFGLVNTFELKPWSASLVFEELELYWRIQSIVFPGGSNE